MKRINQIIRLLTCCLLLTAIAVNKNQRVLGLSLTGRGDDMELQSDEWYTDDGYRIISTSKMAKDIWGYGGNIPLLIYLKDNKIDSIEIQSNSESPDFLSSVIRSGLLSKWNGLTPKQALSTHVDAISGATLSSGAIIASVQKAMQYADNREVSDSGGTFRWDDMRFWCVLLIVLSSMIIPMFLKNKYFRTGQLIANVIVLGFWGGNFISLSLLVNFLSNGINVWSSIIPILLLITAFVFPLFGKQSHYCAWVCPMGSFQELLGKTVPYEVKISPGVVKWLNRFREYLWMCIMAVMWLGAGFELLNYELFSVFLFNQASAPLLMAALVFAILSIVIPRPYCRFVCPTGSVIKFYQQSK